MSDLANELELEARIEAKGSGLLAETTEPSLEGGPEEGTTAPDRPRDEQGRFVAETPVEPAEQDAPILGKFRTVDDLASSYQNLESEFSRTRAEISELRQQLGQQAQTQRAAPLTQETTAALDQFTEQNPTGAAMWALQNDTSGVLYERVMENWFDMDPKGASRFERALERQTMEAQVAQRIAPFEQQRQQQEFARDWYAVAQRHPDISEHSQSIMEVAQRSPKIAGLLWGNDTTSEDRQVLIEMLYGAARSGGQAPPAPTPVPPPMAPHVASADSTSASREPEPPMSPAKQAIWDYIQQDQALST